MTINNATLYDAAIVAYLSSIAPACGGSDAFPTATTAAATAFATEIDGLIPTDGTILSTGQVTAVGSYKIQLLTSLCAAALAGTNQPLSTPGAWTGVAGLIVADYTLTSAASFVGASNPQIASASYSAALGETLANRFADVNFPVYSGLFTSIDNYVFAVDAQIAADASFVSPITATNLLRVNAIQATTIAQLSGKSQAAATMAPWLATGIPQAVGAIYQPGDVSPGLPSGTNPQLKGAAFWGFVAAATYGLDVAVPSLPTLVTTDATAFSTAIDGLIGADGTLVTPVTPVTYSKVNLMLQLCAVAFNGASPLANGVSFATVAANVAALYTQGIALFV